MSVISLSGVKNGVDEVLSLASEQHYESVLVIGVKDKKINVKWSGFQEIDSIIGQLEILKHELLK